MGGLDDAGAQDLISQIDDYLDLDKFAEIEAEEGRIAERARQHLENLKLKEV